MTDYEVVDLMQSHVTTTTDIGNALVTTVFAFVVACYLTANRMNTQAFLAMVAIYIPFTSIQLLGIYTNLTRLKGLLSEAASRDFLITEIEIFTPAAMAGTQNFVPFMMTVYITAVTASLVFGALMHKRKLNI